MVSHSSSGWHWAASSSSKDCSYPEAATIVSRNDIFVPAPNSEVVPPKLRYLTAVMSAAALAIAAAPTAAAQQSQTCTDPNTSATICGSPGNVEINDSLSRANTSPQWSPFGEQSGGPYGGSLGGGSR
jgi:hypothetical protein